MKRSITILILLIFFYNTFGFLALHPILSLYYKNLGKQKTEKYSDEEIVELMIFNKDDIENNKIDFRWIHSREFKYRDEMYDVLKKEELGEQLILYCINDKKEKKYEEEFAKKIHDESNNNKRQLIPNHFNLFLSEPAQANTIDFKRFFEITFDRLSPDSYNSVQLDIPSPPPRLV